MIYCVLLQRQHRFLSWDPLCAPGAEAEPGPARPADDITGPGWPEAAAEMEAAASGGDGANEFSGECASDVTAATHSSPF